MESNIPDAKAAFASRLDGISESLGRGEYGACLRNSAELTRLSWVLGQDDWIFLCEVLESVYANMADVVDRRAISGDVESGIRTRLHADMDDVIRSHGGADAAAKYTALRNLRAHATSFQLDAMSRYRRRR